MGFQDMIRRKAEEDPKYQYAASRADKIVGDLFGEKEEVVSVDLEESKPLIVQDHVAKANKFADIVFGTALFFFVVGLGLIYYLFPELYVLVWIPFIIMFMFVGIALLGIKRKNRQLIENFEINGGKTNE